MCLYNTCSCGERYRFARAVCYSRLWTRVQPFFLNFNGVFNLGTSLSIILGLRVAPYDKWVDWRKFMWYYSDTVFVPNSEIRAGEKGDTVEDLVCMVGFYGVAARKLAQKLELVLGVGSNGHFDTCGAFRGAPRKNLVGQQEGKVYIQSRRMALKLPAGQTQPRWFSCRLRATV